MTDTTGRLVGRLLLVVLVVAATGGVATAATGSTTTGPAATTATTAATAGAGTGGMTPAFVVDVAADGDATVTLRLAFDLTTDGDRRAFEALRADRENVSRRFGERLAGVAARTADRTGREMAIGEASAAFATANDSRTGVVELSAAWTNLARVEGDRVRLAEPFASGFEPDRAFVVRGPEGYAFAEGSPGPAATDGRVARWPADASLDGFTATYAPASGVDGSDGADGTAVTTPTPLPGALLVAALTAAGLGVHRRRD